MESPDNTDQSDFKFEDFTPNEETEIYRTVSRGVNAEQTEAIIGSLACLIGVILIIYGLIRLYYLLAYHCKNKVTNVQVTVLPNDSGKKVACVSWDDPERSPFQNLMCIVKNYKITCQCCDVEKILHFLQKDKAKIALEEFRAHKLRVSICYTGRIIQADHWSEASDANEPGCFVLAAPNKPKIDKIVLNKNRTPTVVFSKPDRENGRIVEYVLRCVVEGNLEGKEYQVNFTQLHDGWFASTLHVPLQQNVTYEIQLAALAFHGNREYHGEWSDKQVLHVPGNNPIADRTLVWSEQEWKILLNTVVERVGTEVESLIAVLGVTPQEKEEIVMKANLERTYFKGMAASVLILWKKKSGRNATLGALHAHLQCIKMISLADLFRNNCEKEGIKL